MSEFEKVEGNSAPEPTRISADLANFAPAGAAPGKASAAAGADPLDDLFPRVEIDSLLKGTTILTDAKSDSWKSKKEALETLQAILDQGANKRLKPSMGTLLLDLATDCALDETRHIFRRDRANPQGSSDGH